MDEVVEKFENTKVSENDDNKSDFEGLYKNWGRLGNQEERRKELLSVQKGNRNDKLDKFRGILELVNAVEDDEIFSPQYKTYYRPKIYVAGFHKTSPTYKDVLMMSEWMIEKPEDFSENWYVVPCPKGVRMLVVSSQGSTKCYTKYGQFRFAKRSALPGGNPCVPKMKDRCSVLDCFYYEKTNTMYIVDLLAWNSQPMTDGEVEFRHYWLTTQLAEIPDLQVINKKNQIIFKILPKTPCDPDSFNKFMSTYPPFKDLSPPMDGLLFYHKKAHYVSGETPLVGWLYPYMVPEVIGTDVTVNEAYLLEKPIGYQNQAVFIQNFEAKLAKKKDKQRSSMDTSDSSSVEASGGDKSESKNPGQTSEKMEAEEEKKEELEEDQSDVAEESEPREANTMDDDTKPEESKIEPQCSKK